jgi:hypothetical protein
MTDRNTDHSTSDRVWQPLGGSSRRYRNRLTGEVISRRQYDKRVGNLGRQGFTSYEAKAKAAKSNAPDRVAMRPARGRRAVHVVHTLEEFKKAWSAVVRSKRGTEHVYVLIAKSKHWQERLIGRVSRPNIIVDIPMGFDVARFDDSPITPFLRFLSSWGIRHYRQFLERKGKLGDRVGVWVGYDYLISGRKNEAISIPVREQPLSILSVDGETFGIDEQISLFFVEMDSIKPKVRGVMLRILIRR